MWCDAGIPLSVATQFIRLYLFCPSEGPRSVHPLLPPLAFSGSVVVGGVFPRLSSNLCGRHVLLLSI